MRDDLLIGDREFVRAPNGLLLPSAVAEQRYVAKRPRAADFFAGAGGMSCGLIGGGLEVVAAFEYDCTAVMTYMANLCRYGECEMVFVEPSDRDRMERHLQRHYKAEAKKGLRAAPALAGSGWISHQPREVPGVSYVFVGDVRKLTGAEIMRVIGGQAGDLDLVAGGPPCQGFSRANKNRNVMDPRNSLVFDFARLITELRPRTMMMENVPGILDMVTEDGFPVVDAFVRILEDGGFGALDSLRKSLAAQTGAVGLLRGRRSERTKAKCEAADRRAESDQLGLFDHAA